MNPLCGARRVSGARGGGEQNRDGAGGDVPLGGDVDDKDDLALQLLEVVRLPAGKLGLELVEGAGVGRHG